MPWAAKFRLHSPLFYWCVGRYFKPNTNAGLPTGPQVPPKAPRINVWQRGCDFLTWTCFWYACHFSTISTEKIMVLRQLLYFYLILKSYFVECSKCSNYTYVILVCIVLTWYTFLNNLYLIQLTQMKWLGKPKRVVFKNKRPCWFVLLKAKPKKAAMWNPIASIIFLSFCNLGEPTL